VTGFSVSLGASMEASVVGVVLRRLAGEDMPMKGGTFRSQLASDYNILKQKYHDLLRECDSVLVLPICHS
jgi:hypothetical protein